MINGMTRNGKILHIMNNSGKSACGLELVLFQNPDPDLPQCERCIKIIAKRIGKKVRARLIEKVNNLHQCTKTDASH